MEELGLTIMEAKWLTILERQPNRLVTREQLLARLYSTRSVDEIPDLKMIGVLACKVRRKLRLARRSTRIETVWGMGYRLVP